MTEAVESRKNRYGAIDGLRTIAAAGIVVMHIRANNAYEIEGFLYNRVIPPFADLVFLFMVVSGFGMCCGYYNKVLDGKILPGEFYGKRIKKILPFFGLLVLLDVMISPSVDSLFQAFADLTLLFGFLSGGGSIEVIGVGWFLGLTFVFYICFPFFCYLIGTKKRAWFAFAVSLAYNYVCAFYFHEGRGNILYSGCFFIAGGLIYLYRKEIENANRWLLLLLVAISVVAYYRLGGNAMLCLIVSILMLCYSITTRGGVLENRITKFFSGISMEIYLSHMVVFRAIEKLHLNTAFGNGWVQYLITVVLVLAGATLLSVVAQKGIKQMFYQFENRKKETHSI